MTSVWVNVLVDDNLLIKLVDDNLLIKLSVHKHKTWAVLVNEPDVHFAHLLRELLPPLSRRLAWQSLDVLKGRGDISPEPPHDPVVGKFPTWWLSWRAGCRDFIGDDVFRFGATGSTGTTKVIDGSTGVVRSEDDGPLACGWDAEVREPDRVVASLPLALIGEVRARVTYGTAVAGLATSFAPPPPHRRFASSFSVSSSSCLHKFFN